MSAVQTQRRPLLGQKFRTAANGSMSPHQCRSISVMHAANVVQLTCSLLPGCHSEESNSHSLRRYAVLQWPDEGFFQLMNVDIDGDVDDDGRSDDDAFPDVSDERTDSSE